MLTTQVPSLKPWPGALRRTGTTVERDRKTLVIDPNNGQLLDDAQGDPARGVSCGGGCVDYGAASIYVREGPATTAPAVP